MIDAANLKKLLRYDPATGQFTWLPRLPDMFIDSDRRSKETKAAAWNGRYAGATAGTQLDARGYRVISVDGHLHLAHRLAWLYMHEEWPVDQIDHRDGRPENNRFDNLRSATRSQNQANRKLTKNTSGVRGVSWCKRDQRWLAQIKVRGTQYRLGNYDTIEEARTVYRAAAEKHFGSFARID